MNKLSSRIISISKYIYLTVFFALLSGFFYPLINDLPFDYVVIGVLILFVGLAGGVLVYKSVISEKRRAVYMGGGFALIAISLAYISQLTGRF